MTNTRSYSAAEFKALENCVETLSHTLANTVAERDAQAFDDMTELRARAKRYADMMEQRARAKRNADTRAASQAALTNALRERDHARGSLRTVTADRDRLLGELQSARESLSARRLTIAHEVGSEAFDDMRELRTRAKRYKETREELARVYGICEGPDWQKLVDANQAALLSLQVLREKLGT